MEIKRRRRTILFKYAPILKGSKTKLRNNLMDTNNNLMDTNNTTT